LKDLKVNITELDFRELIDFCFQILKSLLFCNKTKNEKIIACHFIDPNIDDFIAESDEVRMKQIILNFISNAVKFTREGRIKLKCKKIEIEDEFFIKISVSDTGIGIKEGEKALLFKDFGIIENEFKIINNKFGTGLGLSISKSIVERLEIKLDYDSEYMKGSKFYILVPCRCKGPKDFSKSLSVSGSSKKIYQLNSVLKGEEENLNNKNCVNDGPKRNENLKKLVSSAHSNRSDFLYDLNDNEKIQLKHPSAKYYGSEKYIIKHNIPSRDSIKVI
jgi:anti-sigma regulatory factor (Ser/Thr protein kinase)